MLPESYLTLSVTAWSERQEAWPCNAQKLVRCESRIPSITLFWTCCTLYVLVSSSFLPLRLDSQRLKGLLSGFLTHKRLILAMRWTVSEHSNLGGGLLRCLTLLTVTRNTDTGLASEWLKFQLTQRCLFTFTWKNIRIGCGHALLRGCVVLS